MSEPAAVLVMATGVLLGVAALLLALAATLAWAVRVPAVGGVAGRAGAGWLYRDRDDLVFVRGGRRVVLPWRPVPGQAVRRMAVTPALSLVTTFVFHGSDHRVHTVGVARPALDITALEASWRVRDRLRTLSLVPTWIIVPAVVAALTLPWAAAWVAGESVDARITATVPGGAEAGTQCQVWVQRPDGSWSGATFGCAREARVGDVLTVRMLAVPDGALMGDSPAGAAFEAVVGLAALGLIGWRVTMARRAVTSRAITLQPMLASAPGLDGLLENADPERARRLPLEELAAAVAGAERHGDAEDNDLFRSRAVAAWGTLRTALFMVGLAALVTGLFTAASMQNLGAGAVAATVVVVGGATTLSRRLRSHSAWRRSGRAAWTRWDRAAAWRRLDGRVFVVLFDHGGALWRIPVDRVFAPGAVVEIGGPLEPGTRCSVRANGIALFTLGPTERVSWAVAAGMRRDLVQALGGHAASAQTVPPPT